VSGVQIPPAALITTCIRDFYQVIRAQIYWSSKTYSRGFTASTRFARIALAHIDFSKNSQARRNLATQDSSGVLVRFYGREAQ
jgi:hypothetical protein